MLRTDIESITSHDKDIFNKTKTVLLTITENNKNIKQSDGFEENTERIEDAGPEEFYWANKEWLNGVI